MNEEVKEILEYLTRFNDEDKYSYSPEYLLDTEEIWLLYDYITNLQKENEHLRTQVNTYENPDDYTLFYMWLDAKAKDKIKQLQQENERLKERENILQEKFKDWKKEIEKERKHYLCDRTDCCGRIKDSKKYRSLYQEKEDYKSRNEKAIKYINKNKHLNWYVESIFTDDLLKILGGDEE